jgi:hypothetical protein
MASAGSSGGVGGGLTFSQTNNGQAGGRMQMYSIYHLMSSTHTYNIPYKQYLILYVQLEHDANSGFWQRHTRQKVIENKYNLI